MMSSPSASNRSVTACRPATGIKQAKTTGPPGLPSIVNRLTPRVCILLSMSAHSSPTTTRVGFDSVEKRINRDTGGPLRYHQAVTEPPASPESPVLLAMYRVVLNARARAAGENRHGLASPDGPGELLRLRKISSSSEAMLPKEKKIDGADQSPNRSSMTLAEAETLPPCGAHYV